MTNLPSARPPRGYFHAIRYYERKNPTAFAPRWVIVMELRKRVFGFLSTQASAREVVIADHESLSDAVVRTAIENLHSVGLEAR